MKVLVTYDEQSVPFKMKKRTPWIDFIEMVTAVFQLDVVGLKVAFFDEESEKLLRIRSEEDWDLLLKYGSVYRKVHIFLRGNRFDSERVSKKRHLESEDSSEDSSDEDFDYIDVRKSRKNRKRARKDLDAIDYDDLDAIDYDDLDAVDYDEEITSPSTTSDSADSEDSEDNSSEESDSSSDNDILDLIADDQESTSEESASSDEESSSSDEESSSDDEVVGFDEIGQPIGKMTPTAHVVVVVPHENPKKEEAFTLGPYALSDDFLASLSTSRITDIQNVVDSDTSSSDSDSEEDSSSSEPYYTDSD